MKPISILTLTCIVATLTAARAQLVADGGTATINGISTNITGSLTIGTNGSSTTLIITNAGTVANTDIGIVGAAASSKTNRVVVTGTGSTWRVDNYLHLGSAGSFNQLLVTNNGVVQSLAGVVGASSTSSNNVAVVTGAGSLWTNNNYLSLHGSYNSLVVSNGGLVAADSGYVGNGVGGNDMIVVTGTNSRWISTGELFLGGFSSFNRLVVTNGGTVADYIGKIGGPGCSNNLAVVAGAQSTWTTSFILYVGLSGSFNQLIVTNGGVVQSAMDGRIGFNVGSTLNTVVVAGNKSLWTNTDDLTVGYSGSSNQLAVSDSGIVSANNLYIGFAPSSSDNTTTLSGGNCIVTNTGGTGLTDVRRGLLTLDSGGRLLTDHLLLTNGTKSRFDLHDGTLQVRNTTCSNGVPFSVGAGNAVSSGTLELFGNGTNEFVNGLDIKRNGLLTGNGTIIGNVTVDRATLSPGASIGQITILGNLTFSGGTQTTNFFELNKALGTNDTITGLTSVTYNGRLLVTNLGGALANGDAFKLFSAGSYGGVFNNISPASPGAGLRWVTNGLTVDGTLRVAAVPTTPPAVGSVKVSNGTNLVINANSGVPYEPVYLLTATNVALPVVNWDYVATNYFDGSGNVGITNAITPGEPQRYFRLGVE